MRKLLLLIVTGSALWSGYWFIGSNAIQSGAEQWFSDQSRNGIIADKAGLSVTGFPNRFDLTIDAPRFSDPASGSSWQAPFLQIFAMTWKPWHIIAAFPPEQVLVLPDQTLSITSQDLMTSLRAKPATDLPLAEARLAGASLDITSDLGWTLGLKQFTVALRAEPDLGPLVYEFGFNLAPLTPDSGFVAKLRAVEVPDLPSPDFPDQVSKLAGRILLTLSAPLDRNAGAAKPYLTQVEITDIAFAWGALTATATGLVEADGNGYAAGKVKITISNWDQLPALLVAFGAIKPELAPTIANGMRALAAQSPDVNVLSLSLDLADGRMSLGPFPLGPAPLMIPPSG